MPGGSREAEFRRASKIFNFSKENGLFLTFTFPQLVGERKPSYYNGLWFQENFEKKLQERYSQMKSRKFPRRH
jgi:hypothetical protein